MSASRKRNRLQQAAATPIAAISVEDLPQDPPRFVRPRQDLAIAEIGTNRAFVTWKQQCKEDVQREVASLSRTAQFRHADEWTLYNSFTISFRGAADLQHLQLRAKEWGMDSPGRTNLLRAFFHGQNSCATQMLHNKRSDAEAANIPVREANLLLQQYAQFLIVSVIELWLVEAANSRDLQIKLQKPGQDLWQYLRSHVNAIVQAVPCNWHVNADDIVHRIACRMLSSRIGILLEAVQPWEIVLKSFQAEFSTEDIIAIASMKDFAARSHLISRWIKAQTHAMKTLSSLAVVGLDEGVQKQMQDKLTGMVKHTEVTTGMWLTRETSVTLRHPTELGNFATWDAIQGLSQIDPALTILSPHQCYDAYTKALPEMAALLAPTAGSSTGAKQGTDWGTTLVRVTGVSMLALCNPKYAIPYAISDQILNKYMNK